jgi:hypothetical protein
LIPVFSDPGVNLLDANLLSAPVCLDFLDNAGYFSFLV